MLYVSPTTGFKAVGEKINFVNRNISVFIERVFQIPSLNPNNLNLSQNKNENCFSVPCCTYVKQDTVVIYYYLYNYRSKKIYDYGSVNTVHLQFVTF